MTHNGVNSVIKGLHRTEKQTTSGIPRGTHASTCTANCENLHFASVHLTRNDFAGIFVYTDF